MIKIICITIASLIGVIYHESNISSMKHSIKCFQNGKQYYSVISLGVIRQNESMISFKEINTNKMKSISSSGCLIESVE